MQQGICATFWRTLLKDLLRKWACVSDAVKVWCIRSSLPCLCNYMCNYKWYFFLPCSNDKLICFFSWGRKRRNTWSLLAKPWEHSGKLFFTVQKKGSSFELKYIWPRVDIKNGSVGLCMSVVCVVVWGKMFTNQCKTVVFVAFALFTSWVQYTLKWHSL